MSFIGPSFLSFLRLAADHGGDGKAGDHGEQDGADWEGLRSVSIFVGGERSGTPVSQPTAEAQRRFSRVRIN